MLPRRPPPPIWARRTVRGLSALAALAAALAASAGVAQQQATLQLQIRASTGSAPLPANLFLTGPDGKPVQPPGLPFWHDHAAINGSVTLSLPPGTYRCLAERGPEWRPAGTSVTLTPGETRRVELALTRLAELRRDGWWSGDLHVHRPPGHLPDTLAASDLDYAHCITWWNRSNPWAAGLPPDPAPRTPDGRAYSLLAGEDEREGGALLFLNLQRPLPIQDAAPGFPPSVRYLRAAREAGGWVDIEKPFWWDLPIWLAAGGARTIGIAHNHMQRGGVLDGEAWGRPRDPSAYPGPLGNGLWTQELYYRILEAGFRLPPSAGSASGVLPNPVGYNRVYAYTTARGLDAWGEAVRAGRSFVTNGPLLVVRADGRYPGSEFRVPPRGRIRIRLTATLRGEDTIKHLEVVRDGKVVGTVAPGPPGQQFAVGALEFTEAGWFLVRAIAEEERTFRFASSAPFWVESAREPQRISRSAVRFLAEWLEERAARVQLESPTQRAETLAELDAARVFYEKRLAEANVD